MVFLSAKSRDENLTDLALENAPRQISGVRSTMNPNFDNEASAAAVTERWRCTPQRPVMLIGGLLLVGLIGCGPSTPDSLEQPPVDIGGRLELFVDDYLIEEMDGLELRMHRPELRESANPPSRGHYATILYDTDASGGDALFRMYNRGGVSGSDGNAGEHTEYFESRDGINWSSPALRLFEVDGTTDNNIVLAHDPPFSHNFSPFIDSRPGVPAAERYKALAGTEKSGLFAFVSADGTRWMKLKDSAVFSDGLFDSQNVSFWSDVEQRYVCYFRTWSGEGYTGLRTISKTTSADFVNWSEPVSINVNAKNEHLYTSGTHPYFRAPHIYIGLATRFQPDRGAATDILLLTSRGTNTFDRTFMEAYIPPGADSLHWANRANYAAVGVIPTSDTEMSMYVRGRRYVSRIDGFVSIHAGYLGGSMETKPLVFDGSELIANVSTSASGLVLAELLDANGTPIPGFSAAEADSMFANAIEVPVSWGGNTDVSELSGQPIRIRFWMEDADLYSIRFR